MFPVFMRDINLIQIQKFTSFQFIENTEYNIIKIFFWLIYQSGFKM